MWCLVWCVALAGCMTSTPVWDEHFGEAARMAAQMQIIDPHAGEHAPSAPGVDYLNKGTPP